MLSPQSSFKRKDSLSSSKIRNRSSSRSKSRSKSPGNLPRPVRKSKSSKVASIGVHVFTRQSELHQSIVDVTCILCDKTAGTREVHQGQTVIIRPLSVAEYDMVDAFIERSCNFICGFIRRLEKEYEIVSLVLVHKDFPCDIIPYQRAMLRRLEETGRVLNAVFQKLEEYMMFKMLYDEGASKRIAICRFADYSYFFCEHEFLGEEHKALGRSSAVHSDVTDEARRVTRHISSESEKQEIEMQMTLLLVGPVTMEQNQAIRSACIESMGSTAGTLLIKRLRGDEERTSYCAAMYGLKKAQETNFFQFVWH